MSDDHKQLTALDLGARRETSENAQLGHRLQLTIGTCGEPLYDRVWQDTLAFADLDEVVAELAQLLGHYRARQALHLDLALSQPRS